MTEYFFSCLGESLLKAISGLEKPPGDHSQHNSAHKKFQGCGGTMLWSPAADSVAPLVRQLGYIWSWGSWGQERPWLDKLCLMIRIQQEALSPQMSCRVGCPGGLFQSGLQKSRQRQNQKNSVMSLWLPPSACCRCQQCGSRISRVGKVKVQRWMENPQCSFLSHPCVTAVLPFIFSINRKKMTDFYVWAVDLQIGDVHSGDEWSQVIPLCKSRIIAHI